MFVYMYVFVGNFVSLLSQFNGRQIIAPKNQWVNGHSGGMPKRDAVARRQDVAIKFTRSVKSHPKYTKYQLKRCLRRKECRVVVESGV